MKRRKFIQISSTGSLAGFMLNGQFVNAFTRTKLLNHLSNDLVRDRSIVMIQLSGGNDGLNSVIPKDQYDKYANLRPTIRIKESDAINLDSNLGTSDEILLHPNLLPFKELYLQGKLNIVHGVGYPNLNRSHFNGRAIMSKGADGINDDFDDGWMARYLHSAFDHTTYLDPLGIQIGNKKPADDFHSEEEHKVDINLTGQDPEGFYSKLSNIGNPKPDFGDQDSEYIRNIIEINNTEQIATNYAQRISEVFTQGDNTVTYPPQFDLANQLKTVAKMISGGSKTKIFLLRIDGFDNHANQVDSQNNSQVGKHANLLNELALSVKAFQDDLQAQGIEDNVVTTTFTEFGRKAVENNSKGTDHGNFGPMFVIGKPINGGVRGTHLSLEDFNYDVKNKHFDDDQMQHDYRQVYSAIIGDFLGASDSTIIDTEFDAYDIDRLNLIENPILNNPYEKVSPINSLKIAPNPVLNDTFIQFSSPEWMQGGIKIYDLQGRIVQELRIDFSSGTNLIPLNLSHLSKGLYVLNVIDDQNQVVASSKLTKQ